MLEHEDSYLDQAEDQAELVALVAEEYEAQMAQVQEQHQEQVDRLVNELVETVW
jgi:hypothetical protein